MFPSADHELTTILQSDEFQQLLKTDATTSEGQYYVAKYFGVHKQWESTKQTNTLRSYCELLCLVKQTSQKDYIWISFWEGMHRHAAITMSLLRADITYNTNSCYVPRTLTSCSFSTAQIKGYQNPHLEPEEIIQEILDGTRTDAPLLKSELTITAYIPTMQVKKIDKIMKVTRTQSQYALENKLNSATQTLSIMLSDWLTICSKATDGQAKNKKPQIHHRIQLHKSMDEKQYTQ
jgi:hypothetical protein